MNFVFTSLQSWDTGIGSNAKSIATELSRTHRVLYINPPHDLVSLLRSGNGIKSGIRIVAPNLFVADLPVMTLSIDRIKSAKMFDSLNRTNNSKYATSIATFANRIEFGDFVHIVDNDIFGSQYLREYLQPRSLIYYRRDWLVTVDCCQQHAARLEPLLATKADYVMTSTPYLARTIEGYNAKTYCIGQGVDLEAYGLSGIRERKLNQKPPVIGYAGPVTVLRFDADLLFEIASARPYYLFVLLGAVDKALSRHRMHSLPNIRFVGLVTPDELPAYIADFDVCIDLQAPNPVTAASYPRKIDEYLSLGKPVVATDTTTMRIFEGYASLCSSVDEYVWAIDRALNTPFDPSRIEFARSHSWENSVRKMVSILTL